MTGYGPVLMERLLGSDGDVFDDTLGVAGFLSHAVDKHVVFS
jgi:hypothetical protein